jgi:hypothetical protein
MTSRLIKGPRARGLKPGTDVVVTAQWLLGTGEFAEVHEHVTLETPTPLTETQRLRTLAAWETDKQWRTS